MYADKLAPRKAVPIKSRGPCCGIVCVAPMIHKEEQTACISSITSQVGFLWDDWLPQIFFFSLDEFPSSSPLWFCWMS